MLLSMLLMMFSASATTCTSCLPWSQQTLTVFGTPVNSAGRLGGYVDEMEVHLGIQDFHQPEFKVLNIHWPNVESAIESQLGPIPGEIQFVFITTTEEYPDATITLGDAVGIQVVYKDGSTYAHKYFQKSGGVFSEDQLFADPDITGVLACDLVPMISAHAHGGSLPNESTTYFIRKSNPASIAGLQDLPNEDLDIRKGILAAPTATTTLKYGSSFIEVQGTPTGGGTSGGVVPGGGNDNKGCHNNAACDGDPGDGKQCSLTQLMCHSNESYYPDICIRYEADSAGILASDAQSTADWYDMRDYMLAHYQLAGYVPAYYLYGGVTTGNNGMTAADFQAIDDAVDRFLHGTGSSVIVTPDLKNRLTARITHASGMSAALDPLLTSFQSELNAVHGMTRNQFCNYLIQDASCDF